MADIGNRPNLKICIDNTEDGSESEGDVRLEEEDAGNVSVQADAGSESEASSSYSELRDKVGDESGSSDDEGPGETIERAILEANIPPEEMRELSPDPIPTPVAAVKVEDSPERERVVPKPQKLNIARSEKEQLADEDIEAMYHSLGFTIAQLEKSNDRGIRLEAIHMRGVEAMEEADLMQYFTDFHPKSVEWIDQESCNVVWQDPMKAARAMMHLSTVSQLNTSDIDSDLEETMETEQPAKPPVESTGEKPPGDGPPGGEERNDDLNLLSDDEDKETGEKLPTKDADASVSGTQDGEETMEVDAETKKSEDSRNAVISAEKEDGEMDTDDEKPRGPRSRIRLKVPPGKWRIGVAHPKATVLFFRFANKADVPLPGAEHRRKFRNKFTARIGSEGLLTEKKRLELKAKQDELEIEKAKEALLKQQRPLEDQSIPDFLLEDVPELPEEFAAYPDPPSRPKPRELHSRSSIQDKRLRMKRKRSESEGSEDTDVEQELQALIKPKPAKRLPIGRMHADEEEEKIHAAKSRSLDPSYVDPTDARSLILKRRHKKTRVSEQRRAGARQPGGETLRMRIDTARETRSAAQEQSGSDSWEDQSEEEDFETFGVSSAPRSKIHSDRHRSGRPESRRHHHRHRGPSRYSRDAKPNLKDLPSLTIQVEAD